MVLGLDVDVIVVENEVSVAVERVGAEVASVELTWVAEVEDALDENAAVEEVRDIVVLGSEVWLGFVEVGLVGVGSEELTVGFIEVVWEFEEDDELALAEVDEAEAVVDDADAVVVSEVSASENVVSIGDAVVVTDTVVVVSEESATTENESTETSDEDIVVPVISPNIVLTSDILLSTCNVYGKKLNT